MTTAGELVQRCYALAYALLEDADAAEEVTARVLTGSGTGSVAETVRRVHDGAVAVLRQRRARTSPGDGAVLPAFATRLLNGSAATDPVLAQLGGGLASLNPIERRAVVLAYFAGYRITEIAAYTATTPAQVRQALLTALPRLARTHIPEPDEPGG